MRKRTYRVSSFKKYRTRVVLVTGRVVYGYIVNKKMTLQTAVTIAVTGLFVYGIYKVLQKIELPATGT